MSSQESLSFLPHKVSNHTINIFKILILIYFQCSALKQKIIRICVRQTHPNSNTIPLWTPPSNYFNFLSWNLVKTNLIQTISIVGNWKQHRAVQCLLNVFYVPLYSQDQEPTNKNTKQKPTQNSQTPSNSQWGAGCSKKKEMKTPAIQIGVPFQDCSAGTSLRRLRQRQTRR